jgi:hypothetical protein
LRLPDFKTFGTRRQVVSPTHRPPLPHEIFLAFISVRRPQGHSGAGRIMSMKNDHDTIGNRSRDLAVCSAVPQPLRHHVLQAYRHYSTVCYSYLTGDLILNMIQGTCLAVLIASSVTQRKVKTTLVHGLLMGFEHPPPQRHVAKAEPNFQFRGIYIRNNLIRIWVSLICKFSGTPD